MMIRRFKFFRGCDPTLWIPDTDDIEYYVRNDLEEGPPLRAIWTPQNHIDEINDIESRLTALLSENIAREVDNEIIRTLTRRINGGDNHGMDYFNHWLRIGNNRA